jgi:hypothetical protein
MQRNSMSSTLTKPVRIYADLHRELKIASANRGEDIQDLIRKAWDTFKQREGKRLYQPVNNQTTAA